MVGRLTLDQEVGVRVPAPQPFGVSRRDPDITRPWSLSSLADVRAARRHGRALRRARARVRALLRDARRREPYDFIRIATSCFVTDVRWPGVSPAGIALRISSPFR